MVRVAPDNDLILDLESVNVPRGARYAVSTDATCVNSAGRTVRIPRNTLLTFRLDRPLQMGVADRGGTRDGHYFDWYDRDRQ